MFVTEWRDLRYNRPHPNWAPYSGIQPLVETVKPLVLGNGEARPA
jgi:hypothetical protein